jgi:hypothetical protein
MLIDSTFAQQHLGEKGTPCQADVSYSQMILEINMAIDETLLEECLLDAVWQEY